MTKKALFASQADQRRECDRSLARRGAAVLAVIAVSLLALAAQASASGGIVALTPSVDFGRGVVGSGPFSKPIEFYNETASSLGVTSITSSGQITDLVGNFEGNCPASFSAQGVPPGGSCYITARYFPSTYGSVTATVTATFCVVSSCSSPVTTPSVALGGDGVPAATLALNPTTLAFGPTALQTASAPQTATLTNDGPISVGITGLQAGGGDAGDFQLVEDGCNEVNLAPQASCTFGVRFSPSQAGARSATLAVQGATLGNPYPALTLNGTGGSLPTGPAGPVGPAGLQGPAGKVELVTCKSSKKKGKRGRRTKCTTKVVSGPVTFKTGALARAALLRGAVRYATGSVLRRGSETQLLLRPLRALSPGRYMLRVTSGDHTHTQLIALD